MPARTVTASCLCYLLERMDEAPVLETDRAGGVPNCAVTWYAFDPARGRRGTLAPRGVEVMKAEQSPADCWTKPHSAPGRCPCPATTALMRRLGPPDLLRELAG